MDRKVHSRCISRKCKVGKKRLERAGLEPPRFSKEKPFGEDRRRTNTESREVAMISSRESI
jgi:rRNA maturation protein Nop10